MSKLTKSELMQKIKTVLGDRTDDDALSLLEDISDTISDEDEEWQKKYNDQVAETKRVDDEWRKKYTERFFTSDVSHKDNVETNPANTNKDKTEEDSEEEKIEKAESVTFDDLFTEKEK